MASITQVEVRMVDLLPKVERTDAIQSFVSQETPIVTLRDSDGAVGTGYCYTIGTGGHAIVALLEKTLVPALLGRDPEAIEKVWNDLLFCTHATSVGAITSLALAAVDTALWDLRCRKMGLPLYKLLGGSRESVPLYSTEGGWLHLSPAQLAEDASKMQAQGFGGSKIKIGSETMRQDEARLEAVRLAVGDAFEIFTDANQSFTLSEAIRRARLLEDHRVGWFEEPLPADDVSAHANLARHTSVPIAVGESLYALSQFKDYLHYGGANIVQVDVARIGGITPWLKVAHLAEAYNLMVCPHFLMELHISLVCAIPNARWLEYIPQLDDLTSAAMKIEGGRAFAPQTSGLGIAWDWDAIKSKTIYDKTFTGAG